MTCDRWGEVNFLSKFQLSSSYGLGVEVNLNISLKMKIKKKTFKTVVKFIIVVE